MCIVPSHKMHVQLHMMMHTSKHVINIKNDFISNIYVLNLVEIKMNLTFKYAKENSNSLFFITSF